MPQREGAALRMKLGRRRRSRAWVVFMSTRVGTAALLAAAWSSLPHRACQALRLVCSTPHQYRARRVVVSIAAGYHRRTAAQAFACFPSEGVPRSPIGHVSQTLSSGDRVSWGIKSLRRRRPSFDSVRMISDETPFFIDPDAPEPSVNGAGQTGLLDGTDDKVVPVGLESEIQSAFMQYAMSIILGRALPDVRDGLKPVHRRILYSMFGLGLSPDGSHRKCARVVGEVLGKYHPHGDMAVYDALVRMAQDFVMSVPLVSGHGNFGSIDNDPAAAMRYTECKLSPIAKEALLTDINMDTVDMMTNFDGNEQEPVVLPSRLPMLLINGASGIAVAMATNIPPHNLGEVVDATVALIRDPSIHDDQLFRLIPGPDFPTGGLIMGLAGSRKLYTTSNGGITVRATTHSEVIEAKGRPKRNALVVTELPYQVNKSALLQKMADMVNDKKLDGISDLRDESDREGVRVVVELKRDAIPQVVENNLFKKTQLQTSFSGNLLALGNDGNKPSRFSLRGALQAFIDFRFATIRRKSAYQLNKVRAREHIVQGMLKALGMIDGVIELVRGSKDTPDARAGLMAEPFGLSETQADAILGLRLGRLTSMEEGKLKGEADELLVEMARLEGLMTHDKLLKDLMVEEMLELKDKHGVPRRTMIKPDEGELHEEDLLANDGSVILITDAGYMKRMPLEEFAAQKRGTRGKAGAKLSSDDDVVQHFFTCQDHDTVLFVSNRGVAYSVRAFQIPVASRTAKGVPVPQVLPIAGDEEIASVFAADEFREDEYLMLLTQQGFIKRTPLAAFRSTSSRGLIIISLGDGDELQWVKRCKDDDSIIIGTRQGYATRFLVNAQEFRPSGRSSRGVKAMNFRDGDVPVDVDVLPGEAVGGKAEGQSLLVMTTRGFGKRVDTDEFKMTRRGGKGVIALKFKKGLGDSMACFRVVGAEDEIMLSTFLGTIVRQRVSEIAQQSRAATGVLVQKLDATDGIKDVALVPDIAPEGDGDSTTASSQASGGGAAGAVATTGALAGEAFAVVGGMRGGHLEPAAPQHEDEYGEEPAPSGSGEEEGSGLTSRGGGGGSPSGEFSVVSGVSGLRDRQ